MKKKTLEEKIKRVGFWTFGGVLWYLVIAFFPKSNYPIYEYNLDRSAAYDIIKDALTLAAAFLAPVAAFVLFIDWKTQHKEVHNEKNSRQIIHACDSCRASIMNYVGVNFEQQYSNFMNNFFTLNTLIAEIYEIDQNSSQFLKNAKEVSTQLNSALPKWIHLVNLHQQNTGGYSDIQLEKFIDLKNEKIKEYSEHIQETTRTRKNLIPLKI